METDPRRSFSVGFVLFIAMLVVILGLFMVGGEGTLERKVPFHVVVDSANSIRPGSRVLLDGVIVGQVTNVHFQEVTPDNPRPGNVIIELGVTVPNEVRIREGSTASLATEGLLGDQVVELTTGVWEKPQLERGSEIPHEQKTLVGSLVSEKTQLNAETLLADLVTMLRDIQEGKGTFGQFLKDDRLYETTNSLLEEARRNLAASADIMEGIEDGSRPLSSLLLGPEDAHALSDVLRSTATLALRLERDDTLAESLGPEMVDAIANLSAILRKIDSGEGTLGRLVNDPTLADNLNNVFLGVREESVVRNLIRNAEASGRKLYAEAASREEQEAAIRAAISARARAGEDAAGPVPAAAGGDAADPAGLDLPVDEKATEDEAPDPTEETGNGGGR